MTKKEIENFKKQFEKFKLPKDIKFDPFPFEDKFEPLDLSIKNRASIKVQLFDGTFVKLPLCDYLDKAIIFVNVERYLYLSEKSNAAYFSKFCYKLHLYTVYNDYHRILPCNIFINYPKEDDERWKYVSDCMNYILNKKSKLVYPPNWFNVMKHLVKISASVLGPGGDVFACYCFAAPRCYFKYCKYNLTDEQIAHELITDNL